jgi:hypothetical protein
MRAPPDHIRAVAARLRRTAGALDLDLGGLHPHAGLATWEGPAADRCRHQAVLMAGRAGDVSAGLRRVADLLDEAALVEARAQAEAAARSTAAALAP